MNRLELKKEISYEMERNPVVEESEDGSEELTLEELQPMLEDERADPADQSILEVTQGPPETDTEEAGYESTFEPAAPAAAEAPADPFQETDLDEYFDYYLDPPFKSPASETVEKPPFETFLPSPITLSAHLHSQLAQVTLSEAVRNAAEGVIGNLDENGYLLSTSEEIAAEENLPLEVVREAIRVVHTLDPAGVGACGVRECLLLQIESNGGKGGVAWQIVLEHLNPVELKQPKELARSLHRPLEHIQVALNVIRHLNPRPGLRYSGPAARTVEPDVYISKDGRDYRIEINDEGIPQLRVSAYYRRMLDGNRDLDKDARNYVKEHFASALQLMKNIEQRKHTIMRVCQCIVRRQGDLLERGIDQLKPMMIKEIAEEIGVHPSTVSRAVSNKYAHTPQGVYELRYLFSEAVQGPNGGVLPLPILKRKVKKMIDDEDRAHPLTDEHITERLRADGIRVTRRTVAKYREDMRIPSTHERRERS